MSRTAAPARYRKRIVPGDGDSRHGTENGYQNGHCPGECCRVAHALYQAGRRPKRVRRR